MSTVWDDLGAVTPSTQTTAVVAAGSTQATAPLATAARIVVTSTPLNAGIILPADLQERRVFNRGSSTLSVYPPVGGQWETLGVNQPGGVAVNGSATFHMATATQGYIA